MGGSGADEVGEPNLTPLLDLVLQMVMFFMIVANFVTEQLNAKIQLPESSTTVPIDREVKTTIILNIDEAGQLLETDKGGDDSGRQRNSAGQIKLYMDDLFKFYKDNRGEKGAKDMTVIVRAHEATDFEHVYRVMKASKDAGFVKIQLRAKQLKKGS